MSEGRGPGARLTDLFTLPVTSFTAWGLGGRLSEHGCSEMNTNVSTLRPPLQRYNLSCSDQLTEVGFLLCLKSTKFCYGLDPDGKVGSFPSGIIALGWGEQGRTYLRGFFENRACTSSTQRTLFSESRDSLPVSGLAPASSHSNHLGKKKSVWRIYLSEIEQLEVNELKLEGNPFVHSGFQWMLSRQLNQFINREEAVFQTQPSAANA